MSTVDTLAATSDSRTQRQAESMQGDTPMHKETAAPPVPVPTMDRQSEGTALKAAAQKLNFWYGTNHALKGIAPEKVTAAFLSHAHADHIGGFVAANSAARNHILPV